MENTNIETAQEFETKTFEKTFIISSKNKIPGLEITLKFQDFYKPGIKPLYRTEIDYRRDENSRQEYISNELTKISSRLTNEVFKAISKGKPYQPTDLEIQDIDVRDIEE